MAENIHDLPEVDALYRLEPSDFTKERNRLAKHFKDNGDKKLADQVTALRKPTKVAWALNKVAYDKQPEVDGLVEAASKLRIAQRALVEHGVQDDFREVQRSFRDAIIAVQTHVSERAGNAAGVEVAAKLEQTAWDETALMQLLSRHIASLDDVEPGSGFDLFEGITPKIKPEAVDKKHDEESYRLERDVQLAEGDVERARKGVGMAQERLAHAEAMLANAKQKFNDYQ